MADIFVIEIREMIIVSTLPLMILLIPILGSFLIGFTGLKLYRARNILAVLVTGLTLYLTVELFLLSLQGYSILYRLPSLAGISMNLRVDLTGSVFALFTALIWFLATLSSVPYMKQEIRQTRYYTFLILSLGGCLGVFLSGDYLSLFLFFELMTLAAYALVVHNQDSEAMAAGKNYLYLGVIGGLSLLSGIILLNTYAGSVTISPLMEQLAPAAEVLPLIALLMIIGFGVKAGMVPLHIWLPQAHPVAPSPASALLSGIMIKTGAYGIIRVVTMLFTPTRELAESGLWHFSENLGHVIVWMGILTMLLAALMAVLQNNAKTLLAYSSISQMGYILMGIGAAGYLGYDGPMGFGGFSYHIINHAFFKSGMFILFGIIYTRLHEKRLDHLGGLWKHFPVTFAAFAVCAAGIMGIPGFNGYVSKTLLHHAIVEAFEHHHLWDLWLAEKLFMLTSGLTVCYIGKLFISIFLGKESDQLKGKLSGIKLKENIVERFVGLAYIAAIVFLGLFSPLIIKKVIVPMAGGFTYSDYYLNYLAKTGVWTWPDLFGIVIGLGLGAAFYLAFKKKELFSLKLPEYLSVERSLYQPATKLLGEAFTRAGKYIDDNVNFGFHGAPGVLVRVSTGADYLDDKIARKVGLQAVRYSAFLWNKIYDLWAGNIRRIFAVIGKNLKRVFMLLFKFDYSTRGDKRFQTVNISNIDFDLYIILVVVGAILATSLLFIL
ncbi:MAG: proton-conducting transporter membrane subunit [Bacillota bacterium]|nr:proton-conducting transporter membrane subunit [Bacillota bacterium]